MIAAWLNREDNVLKVGVPSWSVLKSALRKIKENSVADQIVISTDMFGKSDQEEGELIVTE